MIGAMLGLVAFDLAVGQQIQIPGMTGRGGARFDPITLLYNSSVKKELRMTDDQAGKVEDAVWKALAEVLNAEQLKRLRQIELQQMDYLAFANPKIQGALKMTDDQIEDIATIMKDAEKVIKEAEKAAPGGGKDYRSIYGGTREGDSVAAQGGDKMQAIKEDIREKCTSTLTAPQKRLWLEMIGEEFKLEPAAFDFGKRGGKKKGGD
jgi:hypothetical protein